jgi:hypothetical protein
MPNYQHKLGIHHIGIHYEPNYAYYKKDKVTPMFKHPLVKVWVIGKDTHYPQFRDNVRITKETWDTDYKPRIKKLLNETFKKQKKLDAWVKNFWEMGDPLTQDALKEAEKLQYAEEFKEEVIQKEKPDFETMTRKDMCKWLASNDNFDMNPSMPKPEILAKCTLLYDEMNKSEQSELLIS